MANLEVLIHPHKTLRENCSELDVSEIKSEKIQKFIQDMADTMVAHKGIGLAAPQVSKTTRLFLVQTKDGPAVFINPKIIFRSIRKEVSEEGCLSIPGVFGQVKRSKSIRVTAYNQQAEKFTMTAKGLLARVILHENDHINGVLFIDKAEKITEGNEKIKDVKEL